MLSYTYMPFKTILSRHHAYKALNVDSLGAVANTSPILLALRAALPACNINTSAATSRLVVGSTLPRPSANREPKDQAGLGRVCPPRKAKVLGNACCGRASARQRGCGG